MFWIALQKELTLRKFYLVVRGFHDDGKKKLSNDLSQYRKADPVIERNERALWPVMRKTSWPGQNFERKC